jgi:hypothetical protein
MLIYSQPLVDRESSLCLKAGTQIQPDRSAGGIGIVCAIGTTSTSIAVRESSERRI